MTLDAYIGKHEGCRLKPYLDSRGHLSIGRGINLDDGITPAEEQFLYESRKAIATRDAIAALGAAAWTALDEIRRCALIDMAYELGAAKLRGFAKMLDALRAGDWQAAHDECLDSAYAREVPARARDNATIFLTGRWPDAV